MLSFLIILNSSKATWHVDFVNCVHIGICTQLTKSTYNQSQLTDMSESTSMPWGLQSTTEIYQLDLWKQIICVPRPHVLMCSTSLTVILIFILVQALFHHNLYIGFTYF